MAADLRTALTPVLGYLDLLLEQEATALTEQQLQWIVSVERQLHNLRDLSEELMVHCRVWRDVSVEQPPELERRLH